MSKTFKVVTLGCRTNQYESQAFSNQLTSLGYQAAKDEEKADLCLVNSCTVTASADSHSRHAIRQLVKQNPGAKVVVTGCFAERNPDEVKAIEGVAAVVPNKDKENLLANLFPDQELPEFAIENFEAHTRAFVKVQDGCNSFCTYCIIPYVRGRSKSRTVEEVVHEVEGLVANGYKEVVITGINVGDFDGRGGAALSDLVRACDEVEGLERLRISSIDPDEVDEALLDAVVNGKKTCQSMHIVLQSGSNVVLKRMNRKYTRQIFIDTVEKLKKASPDFTFTTDIIVGFPGETEVDFQETLGVMEEVQFAKVHMFPYSDRPRTRSNLMPNKVPAPIIQERKARLLQQAENHAFHFRERYVGKRMMLLTEKDNMGHTDNFLQATIIGDAVPSNQLVKVELFENRPEGLLCRLK